MQRVEVHPPPSPVQTTGGIGCAAAGCSELVPFGKRKYCRRHSGEASRLWKQRARAEWATQWAARQTHHPYWSDWWLKRADNDDVKAHEAQAAYMRAWRQRRQVVGKIKLRTVAVVVALTLVGVIASQTAQAESSPTTSVPAMDVQGGIGELPAFTPARGAALERADAPATSGAFTIPFVESFDYGFPTFNDGMLCASVDGSNFYCWFYSGQA